MLKNDVLIESILVKYKSNRVFTLTIKLLINND